MKKEAPKEVRNIIFKLRLNQSEKDTLRSRQQKSTEKDLSAYIRKVSLAEPVTVRYRNATADEFLAVMLQLKKELSAIGNNFNQAVKKLHILDKIPEFRVWIHQNESLHTSLANKIKDIHQCMVQMQEKW